MKLKSFRLKAWKLLRAKVLKRDKKCLRCGSKRRLNGSHIVPKGLCRSMEFDEDNIIILCYRCHMYWWHKHPLDAYDWFISKFGINRWLDLRNREIYYKDNKIKRDKKYFEKLIKKLS